MSLRSKILKFSAGLIAAFSLAFVINQSSAQSLDDSKYKAVKTPFKVSTGDKIEVAELFWFSCGHCFALEPAVNKWKASKPDNAEFVKVPAVFGKRGEFHAKAFYTMKALDAPEQAYEDFFKKIHVERKRINDLGALVSLLANYEKTEEQVTSAFNSFLVDNQVRTAAKISRQSGATGVPTIVVDGKYLTGQSMHSDGATGLFNTVNLLVEKAAAER